jgi:uncharacterized protein YjbJ (UPF0337 family)
MDRAQFVGQWRQLRGALTKEWGRLTDHDLDMIAGDYDLLVGRIHTLYGSAREEIDHRLDEIARRPAA